MRRTHGNPSTYQAGCRCDDCRAANTAKRKAQHDEWLARRVEIDGRMVAAWAPAEAHGRESTYANLGCRCDPCTEAGARKNARHHAKRREAAA